MINIINSDCFSHTQFNIAHTIITDPPYGVTQDHWDIFESAVSYKSFTKQWMELCYNVAKPDCHMFVFFSQKYMPLMFSLIYPNNHLGWNFKRMLIWHHPNLAKTTRKMFLWTYDPLFYFTKGNPKMDAEFTKSENVDVFRFGKPQSNYNGELFRYHPSSKPVKLVEILTKITTQPNDTVFDPFVGGGTTPYVCMKLGRNFIGYEKDPQYYKVAMKRIQGTLSFQLDQKKNFSDKI